MKTPCHHCDGHGYTELRDCAGDVQREETCVFCEGLGEIEVDAAESADLPISLPTPDLGDMETR